jgi:hypothetical protein
MVSSGTKKIHTSFDNKETLCRGDADATTLYIEGYILV